MAHNCYTVGGHFLCVIWPSYIYISHNVAVARHYQLSNPFALFYVVTYGLLYSIHFKCLVFVLIIVVCCLCFQAQTKTVIWCLVLSNTNCHIISCCQTVMYCLNDLVLKAMTNISSRWQNKNHVLIGITQTLVYTQ